MSIRLFRSTDTGAPAITGIAGSGIAVLDAILVDGYNSKTVTLTRSGSTVTATATSHGFVRDQLVTISGADQTDYNGSFKVTDVPSANTFTYTVTGTPASPATGTITAIVASAGWTKPYSGTNLAAYRMPAGTNQHYLRVEDTAGQSMRVRGYEAMSSISSGTGPFPTTAQFADPGLYWWKSDAATSATREWIAISDGKVVYLFVAVVSAGFATGSHVHMYAFGEFASTKSGDAYNTLIIGNEATGATTANSHLGCQFAIALSTNLAGHYVTRSYTQLGGSIQVSKIIDNGKYRGLSATSASNIIGANGMLFPNPSDGGLYVSRITIGNADILRGHLRGLYAPLHYRPFDHAYRFVGANDLPAQPFLAVNVATGGTGSGNGGQFLLQLAGTW